MMIFCDEYTVFCSSDQFKTRDNIEAVTTNWSQHSKAFGKRAEIARILAALGTPRPTASLSWQICG